MRVAAYLRVSTDRQAERGQGLGVQRQAIKSWAKTGGHKVTSWHSDEGVSGSNGLEARLELADALEALRDDRAQGIVVYRLDRLARDLILQETLLSDIRRIGAKAFSTSAAEASYLTDDPDDPSRKLIRQVLGAVAEYERGMIALRLRSGRRRKHERGGFAYGAPRLGFVAVDGELKPDATEQAVVARITELQQEGASLRDIAVTLNEEGHPPKRGNRWHPESIRRVKSRARLG
jgi:DNA invertase Pin-like site-specific DNA recombinase